MPSSIEKIEKPFNLRLDSDLKALLVELASNNNQSLNSHITTRLRDGLYLEGAGVERSMRLLHEVLEANFNKDRPIPPSTLRLERLLNDYNLIRSNRINHSHLAYVLGYDHPSSVEYFFSGKTSPSFSELKRFSDFFNCDEAWLATGLGAPYLPKINKLDRESVVSFVSGLITAPDTSKKIKSIIFVASPCLSDVALILRVFSDNTIQSYILPEFKGSYQENIFRATLLNVAYAALRTSLFEPNTLALSISTEDFESLLLGHDHPSSVLNSYIETDQLYKKSQPLSDYKYPLAEIYQLNAGFDKYGPTSLRADISLLDNNDHPVIKVVNESPNLIFN